MIGWVPEREPFSGAPVHARWVREESDIPALENTAQMRLIATLPKATQLEHKPHPPVQITENGRVSYAPCGHPLLSVGAGESATARPAKNTR